MSLLWLAWLAAYVGYLILERQRQWHFAYRMLDLAMIAAALLTIIAFLAGAWSIGVINAFFIAWTLRTYPRTDLRAWIERTFPRLAGLLFSVRTTSRR